MNNHISVAVLIFASLIIACGPSAEEKAAAEQRRLDSIHQVNKETGEKEMKPVEADTSGAEIN